MYVFDAFSQTMEKGGVLYPIFHSLHHNAGLLCRTFYRSKAHEPQADRAIGFL